MEEEDFWLRIPCITLRDNTEWIETVELGANFLVGCDAARIVPIAKKLINDSSIRNHTRKLPNPDGDDIIFLEQALGKRLGSVVRRALHP